MTVLKKTNIVPLALAIAPARPALPRHRPRSSRLAIAIAPARPASPSPSPPLVPPRHRPRSPRHAIAPARLAIAIAPARHRPRSPSPSPLNNSNMPYQLPASLQTTISTGRTVACWKQFEDDPGKDEGLGVRIFVVLCELPYDSS
jgi:hypothetical protein